MSGVGGRSTGHRPSFGPGQALLDVDPEEYEDTQAAVQAALQEVPRFVCPECGLKIFSRPTQCRDCGTSGGKFGRQVPAEVGQ